MRIWYMRDNHTFLSLPLDVDAAMVELHRAFIEEHDTYGSLCCKEGPMRNKMEHAKADWSEFEPRARRWIEAALKPTDAEIEYASWLMPNGPGEPPERSARPGGLGGFFRSETPMACTHTKWVYDPPYEDDWTGEWITPEPRQVGTSEDIDIGRFRCTQCGEVGYYTGLWRDFHEKGIPCPGSDGVRRLPPNVK